MRLPGYLLAFLLVIMLASTTSAGTGSGVHQFDVLHPLFDHVHIVNGRILTHEEMAEEAMQPPVKAPAHPGPAFGAGGGAAAADAGVGVSPVVPNHTTELTLAAPSWWLPGESRIPTGREEAPPDPPPL
jgi:hypothetical protein